MRRPMYWFTLTALALLGAASAPAQDPGAPAAAIADWQAQRFGMFIHWGPVSLPGHEIGWSRGAQTPIEEYDALYQRFNPTNFNAQEWVAVARKAGMKYLVLTTKHHDGFCLWDTKELDYNIMRSPFARDVMKELAAACRAQGIRLGTYYSTCDWYHPAFPLGSPGGRSKKPNPDLEAYTVHLEKQVAELITNYGPLFTLWFDVPQQFDRTRGERVLRHVRGLQPNIVVNNRTGAPGDYDTPEQKIGGFQRERPWETCMTICQQWAWKPNDHMKSLEQCLRTLLQTVGGDGNLLFNVGPMPDGRIEPRQVERLAEMGAWLARHGSGVYGSRGGPYMPGKWGVCTSKDGKMHLYLFQGLDKGPVQLNPLPLKVVSAQLDDGTPATVRQTDAALEISVPAAAVDPIATHVILTVEGDPMAVDPLPGAGAGQGVRAKKITASNVFQQDSHYAAGKVADGDPGSRWATDGGVTAAWLEFDFGKPVKLKSVVIEGEHSYVGRIQKYALERWDGQGWVAFSVGTQIAEQADIAFEPMEAQRVRLNITAASDGPTLNEISWLPAK